jgi:molybdate transport system substrate-binding protein
VAVASNMSYAIKELRDEFSKSHKNIKIKIIIASSGKIASQIINGAPFDIFISADMFYPNKLHDMKLAKKPIAYAKGSIVLFTDKDIDLKKGIKILQNQNIKKIAIANPKTAPYGKAAIEAIKNSGIQNSIKRKLIFAESVSGAFSYAKKITDIAIIAKSTIYNPNIVNKIKTSQYVDINRNLYKPIKQGMTLLARGYNSIETAMFYNFLKSKEAKKILQRFGYIVD